MANWEVFDINEVKVGEMTQEEVDVKLIDSESLDGLNYFYYDTNIYTDLTTMSGSENARVIKSVEDGGV